MMTTNIIFENHNLNSSVHGDDIRTQFNCTKVFGADIDFTTTTDYLDNIQVDKNMQRPELSQPCNHVFCEFWGDRIMCKDCLPPYEIVEEVFPEVYRRELNWRKKLGEEDSSSPDDSVNRGVTIQFLVDFCNKYNLWHVPTWKVRRDYVIPMTSEKRCRFVELPSMMENDIVGPATTFISHCWSAPFGDAVAAMCDGRSDYSVRVWFDIFAVLQWPSTKNEYEFELVIRKCPSFLIVCPKLSELELGRMNVSNLKSPDAIAIRAKIPFFRGWCIYELYYAFDTVQVTVVVKCGSHIPEKESPKTAKKFKNDDWAIFSIVPLIDIHKADFTVPSDRDFRKGPAVSGRARRVERESERVSGGIVFLKPVSAGSLLCLWQ